MGFSDLSGPFCLDDGFVAATSSNIEIGGKGSAAMAFFVLEHGQVRFCQGFQGCFWVCKLLEKTVPAWRGLRSNCFSNSSQVTVGVQRFRRNLLDS